MRFLFSFFLFFLSIHSYAVTVTPLPPYYGTDETNSGGVRTIYFPVYGKVGTSCETSRVFSTPLINNKVTPTYSDGPSLRFRIANTSTLATINGGAAVASDSISIRVEKDNATPVALIDYGRGYNDAGQTPFEVKYGSTDGAVVDFGIALVKDPTDSRIPGTRTGDGFCDIFDAISGSQDCRIGPANNVISGTITVGLVQKNNTFANALKDTTSFQIVIAACPPNATSGAVVEPTLGFSVTPQDGAVRIQSRSIAPTDLMGLKSVVVNAGPSVPVDVTASHEPSYVLREYQNLYGEYMVDGLQNGTKYCFSLGYINKAGIMTAGAAAATTYSANMPQISPAESACTTPNTIEGFLNRSTCFIASAVYENEWDPRLEVLRQFRDQILHKSRLGQKFENWYYAWSPNAARWVFRNGWIRPLLKPLLLFPYLTARALLSIQESFAQEVDPYIESLRKKHKVPARKTWPPKTIPAKPSKISEVDQDSAKVQPHIDKILSKPEEKVEQPVGLKKQEKVDENASTQPHIDSLKSGYKLQPKYKSPVHHAAGFALVATGLYDVTSDKTKANDFSKVYNIKSYNPGLDLFYEYQLLRNRWGGALALNAHLGMLLLNGKGFFVGTTTQSEAVKFRFFALPASVGATYRLLLFRLVVPFAQAGVMSVPFLETRNDGKASKRGVSGSLTTLLGAGLNLDWLSRKNAWDLYDTEGVMHTYLVVQLQRIQHFLGNVAFNYAGLYAGFMFEF